MQAELRSYVGCFIHVPIPSLPSNIKWMPVPQIGALGITIANPTDLVKVRLQAEGKLPPGVPRRYSGALNAYSTILRQVKIFNSTLHSPLLPRKSNAY